ncbi:MAG: hypothetical protein Q4F21_03110 [Lachnospiraceae bacterium]|nr:hypothetical protein [Lachnospiraceae bacterium]
MMENMGNYTYVANDYYFNQIDIDLSAIWNDIENTPESTEADKWKKKIEHIVSEYVFSSRFAIMRILYHRVKGSISDSCCETEKFEITINNKCFTFNPISMDYAKEIDKTELMQYESVLLEMASAQHNTDDAKCRQLIAKALADNKSKTKKERNTFLTREEAFELGHILSFSLQEMEWFLLRVFDFEDGFRFNTSNDLIEAYGFIVNATCETISRLKSEYSLVAKNVSKNKQATHIEGWTRIVKTSFPDLVKTWALNPATCEEQFKMWLYAQRSNLDIPSKTAIQIYRKIALYAYCLCIEDFKKPDFEVFLSTISQLCRESVQLPLIITDFIKKELKEDNISFDSERICKKISAELLEKNKELYTSSTDRAKAWRTISASENGSPRLIMAGRPDAERNRVQKLLSGTLQIEKGDMLHLLWFAFSLCWLKNPIEDRNDIFNGLADFTETAEMVLEKSLLPKFYPPHIMEQSMMLSIIACEETGEPADVYAEICESLIMSRNRSSSKKKN